MADGGSAELRELEARVMALEAVLRPAVRDVIALVARVAFLEMQVAGLNGRVDDLSGRAAVREVAAVAKPPGAGKITAKRSR